MEPNKIEIGRDTKVAIDIRDTMRTIAAIRKISTGYTPHIYLVI